MERPACVYILTNKPFGTLYIGVTSDLLQRSWQHKNKFYDGFSKKYGLHKLVYYEIHDSIVTAILREKQMKKWKRNWKLRQIMDVNPEWNDLYNEIVA